MRIVVASIVVALGCGGGKAEPSVDELITQLGPKIEPKVVIAENIAKAPLPDPTGKIKLSGPMIEWIQYYPPDPVRGNTALAFDADLKDLHNSGFVLLRTAALELINDCWMIMREKKMAGADGGNRVASRDDFLMKLAIPKCAAVRYLVVVRLDEFQNTKYVDKEHFVPGSVRASALVFDLETGAYLGGVPVSASSKNYVADPDSDLKNNFHNALQDAINKVIPGANLHS